MNNRMASFSPKICSLFVKKHLFIASFVLPILLFGTLPTSAQLTAYKHWDYGLGGWDYTISTSSSWTELSGSGSIDHLNGGNGSFPVGNSNFYGCIEFTPTTVLHHHDFNGVVWNDAEGTIECWIAPHWNGENQGGNHPNATYQDVIIGDGVTEWQDGRQGFNLFFFDNNYGPTPGYQMFVVFTDNDSPPPGVIAWENWDVGNTMDWIAGSWHHVCISWDADEVMAGIDGTILAKKTRNGGFNFAGGGYLFGMNRAGGPENCWDGWADDLAVYDNALYTGYGDAGDSYPLPAVPVPLYEPSSPQDVWDWGFGMSNDLNMDCFINFLDYAGFAASQWDFIELAVFANDWLRSNHPDDPYGEKPWRTTYSPSDPCNILENPSFEYSSDTAAAFWAYQDLSGQHDFYIAGNAHTGDKCLAITTIIPGSARWYSHNVWFVEGAGYRLSCWVKSEGTGISGSVEIPNANVSHSFTETPVWTYVEKYFLAPYTDMDPIYLWNNGSGTVFLDDLSVEMTTMPTQTNQQTIPTNTEPLNDIVVPDNPTVADHYAALEVQRVLKEMTGTELDIIPQTYSVFDTGCIYINCAPDISEYSADLAVINDEGIVLDVNDNIICLGNTKRGIYYATQELLYQLGCRWYTPWDGGECIPNAPTLTLNYQKIIHNPSFTLRGNSTAYSYHYPPTMTVDSSHGGFLDWAARNRMNALTGHYVTDWGYSSYRGQSAQDWAGHTIHKIVEPSVYFASHPEYFPEVNYPEGTVERTYTTPWAGRPANVDVSNTDVIQICADFVIDYFNTHPYADRVHIGQMDVGAHCECSSCRALDPPGSVDWSKKTSGILVFTDRWLSLINRIADIVKLSHPTKYVSTYSYAETHTLPIDSANDPCDNVMIEYCWAETNFQNEWDIVRCYKHDMNDPTCPNNVEGMQILNDWVALAPISIYSYYLYYNNPGTAGSYAHHDASFYKALHDAGVRCVNDEVGTDMVSAPLLLNLRARLLWDIDTDVDQYIDDFCNNVYGPAATFIKQYFTTLEETVSLSSKTHVYFNDFDLFTPAIITELNDYLDLADFVASRDGDTTLLARIARLRIAMIYTEIKTLTDPVAIDALQAQANTLVQTYDIPIRVGVWDVLAP